MNEYLKIKNKPFKNLFFDRSKFTFFNRQMNPNVCKFSEYSYATNIQNDVYLYTINDNSIPYSYTFCWLSCVNELIVYEYMLWFGGLKRNYLTGSSNPDLLSVFAGLEDETVLRKLQEGPGDGLLLVYFLDWL